MFFVILFASLLSTSLSIESNFYSEEACLAKNGYCVFEEECSAAGRAEPESYKALCTFQRSLGAICCKDFPLEEVNCNQLHNECVEPEKCPHEKYNLGRKGCDKTRICCAVR
ncbi:uncharacterized protein LOC123311917 [Coccinella septempunctata]|uniref:uncharacterized protein LOC123311917 n=1 Tax=Coccinella septempunctata TaxID=41139 RepID=UPI001D068138|nr:uncharacterized protein LOC123311917 [Coccinella septempunctata]